MFISAHMITYNGMPFITKAIENMLPFVDEFIIVEGAVKKYIEEAGASSNGISTDGTHEYLERMSKHQKIKYKMGGVFPNKNIMRDNCLKLIRQIPHWIWLIDDDEVYDEKATQTIIDAMEKNIEVSCLTFLHVPIKRFDRWTPPDKYKYMERVVWFKPGSTYGKKEGGQCIYYPNGKKVWDSYKVIEGPARCHHYHIMSDDNYHKKNKFYVARGDFGKVPRDKIDEVAREMTKEIKSKWQPWPLDDHPRCIKTLDIYKEYLEWTNKHE